MNKTMFFFLICGLIFVQNYGYASDVTRNTISGNAIHFDGFGDFLEIQYDPSLMLQNQYTYETWYKADSLGDSGSFFAKYLNESPYEFKGFSITSDVKLATIGWNPTGFGSSVYSSADIIQTGIWYHLAVVYDGSFVRFFVDGQQSGPAINASGDIYDSTVPAYMGKSSLSADPEKTLDGTMDEFRFYSRSLTPSEILQSYNDGVAGIQSTVSTTSLRIYMAFDEGTGTTAYDSSSFSNDGAFGTLENSPEWVLENSGTIPEPSSLSLLGLAVLRFVKRIAKK